MNFPPQLYPFYDAPKPITRFGDLTEEVGQSSNI